MTNFRIAAAFLAVFVTVAGCNQRDPAAIAAAADADLPDLNLPPVVADNLGDEEKANAICSLPLTGEWTITGYRIVGDVVSIGDADAQPYIGKTVILKGRRISVGDEQCVASQVDPDFIDDPDNLERVSYYYQCEGRYDYRGLAFRQGCQDPELVIAEARFALKGASRHLGQSAAD